ncbi:1,4-alpha-glucan branching protein GlgB [Tundrisphaera sp. TA3]|uniref:1,4-alpha-glucan branching protein GlgB n=1 Tax=Tundrisphaera sp. TA3 TaxID=3435775 RepID=UPI003EBD6BF7
MTRSSEAKTMAPATATPLASPTTPADVIDHIIHGNYWDPFSVLGQHEVQVKGKAARVIRAFLPDAAKAWVVRLDQGEPGTRVPMTRVRDEGFFEVIIPDHALRFPYRLAVENHDGHGWEFVDPYQFGPVLTDYDLHLLGEGTHYKNYEKLGAHVKHHEGIQGVHFAVWAPNALRVSVIGDFNHWDGRRHAMRAVSGGFWEIFLPDLRPGEVYKFEIKSRHNGYLVQKADPYGFAAELRPKTASKVWDVTRFAWNDQDWMKDRAARQGLDAPVSIYECHLGSWKRKPEDGDRYLTYRELADDLVAYLRDTGFTHVELLPITEHPFDGSWGYQPIGMFAPTARHGTPDDFAYFVDTLHRHGYGVILDWVPAHFPRDLHGLGFFDGTHLYEHEDPRLGEHLDWGTKIYNYGRSEVRNYLIGNALFWLERYHLDGLRVDAVASMLYLDYSRKAGEWIPNIHGGNENLEAIGFLKRLNELCHQEHPGIITAAEESTSFPGVSRPTYLGGLGFSLKWNMGWMNDTLKYIEKDPIHRKYDHGQLSFSLIYAFTENFILPLSHDEVVHGKGSLIEKMPGDVWQKFANLRLLYGYMFGHPGKKLLFMGDELAQWQEWSADRSIDWHLLQWRDHQGIKRLVSDLNHLYKSEPALHQVDFDWQGFEWLELHDWENSVLAFLRRGKDPREAVVVVCNFTPVARENYRIGVPEAGYYREILNTDAEGYAGSNFGNAGGVWAHPGEWSGRPFHVSLRLPPLGVLFLKVER